MAKTRITYAPMLRATFGSEDNMLLEVSVDSIDENRHTLCQV